MTEILGALFIVLGTFFSLVGVVGIIRLPDVFSRIHASGKVATLGIFGLSVGTAILYPDTTLRLIALGLFLLITSPVASHAIAMSAYRAGVVPVNLKRNALAERAASQPVDQQPVG